MTQSDSPLRSLVKTMLRVGSLSFGGPVATMAMMGEELSEKRSLVSRRRYLEGLALVKLFPGPVSSLLAIFLGQEIAGTFGGILALICFVLPSFLALLLISSIESVATALTQSATYRLVLEHLQATVIVIILMACWKLYQDARKELATSGESPWIAPVFAALAAFLFLVAKWNEVWIVLGLGALGMLWKSWHARARRLQVEPLSLFWIFFVSGTTVFGTGYMVLPHLQRILVEERGWLTEEAFTRGIVFGNLTPGPIVIASTYYGFQISAFSGALLATIGIFLGPAVLMLVLGPVIRRYLDRPWLKAFLIGVLPSVAAVLASNVPNLSRGIPWGFSVLGLMALTYWMCLRKRAAWQILLMGAAWGLARSFIPA